MRAVGDIKQCSSCKKFLSLSFFNKHKRAVDKLQNVCKSCKARMTKLWKHSLKSGIYDDMVSKQNGMCAICHETVNELVIDHDHKTDRIRELLCRHCNALLGMCNDNQYILTSAIVYIRRWTEE